MVDNEAVTGFHDAEIFGDTLRRQKQFPKEFCVTLLRQSDTEDNFFWHQQHMHRGFRINVVERDQILIFVYDASRNLTGDDFFEQRHGSGN